MAPTVKGWSWEKIRQVGIRARPLSFLQDVLFQAGTGVGILVLCGHPGRGPVRMPVPWVQLAGPPTGLAQQFCSAPICGQVQRTEGQVPSQGRPGLAGDTGQGNLVEG